MTILECITTDLFENQKDYELIIKSDITNNTLLRYDTTRKALNCEYKDSHVFAEDVDNQSKQIIYYI